jgi:hypothetical protein
MLSNKRSFVKLKSKIPVCWMPQKKYLRIRRCEMRKRGRGAYKRHCILRGR